MKFVPVRQLAKCLGYSLDKTDSENVNRLREKAEEWFKSREVLPCNNRNLNAREAFSLIDGLKEGKNIVFHDWIQRNEALLNVLTEPEEIHDQFFSAKKYEGHFLENSFYSFLTPFLRPILQREVSRLGKDENYQRLDYYLQFSEAIKKEDRIALHKELDEILQKTFSEVRDEYNEETENVKNKVEKITSREFIKIINHLDQIFYATRIKYLDLLKELIDRFKTDEKTEGRIIRALRELKLNTSHDQQLKSYLQQQNNVLKKKQNVRFFNMALFRNPLFYLVFLFLIIIIFLWIPLDKKENQLSDTKKETGLDSLTHDEIIQTDSLLGFKEDSVMHAGEDLSVPLVSPDFVLSTDSENILNQKIAQLYKSMLNDYQIQLDQIGNTDCEALKKSELTSFNYDGVSMFDDGSKTNHKFINASNYDCYILLFENKKNGKAYGGIVPAGGKESFNIKIGWNAVFYSGRELTFFNPVTYENGGYGNIEDAKKISKSFTAHFCEMNYRNFKILSRVYEVTDIGSQTELRGGETGMLEINSNSFEEIR